MDLWGKWNALKFRLYSWYSVHFRKEGASKKFETAPCEEQPDTARQPQQAEPVGWKRQDMTGNLRMEIYGMLEAMRQKRTVSVRRRNGHAEWMVSPADFTDAYLFMRSISGTGTYRIRRRMAADNASYRLHVPDGWMLELTDNTRRRDAQALLSLTKDKECILKIYFINPKNNRL